MNLLKVTNFKENCDFFESREEKQILQKLEIEIMEMVQMVAVK
jgi:hypothetical protein